MRIFVLIRWEGQEFFDVQTYRDREDADRAAQQWIDSSKYRDGQVFEEELR